MHIMLARLLINHSAQVIADHGTVVDYLENLLANCTASGKTNTRLYQTT